MGLLGYGALIIFFLASCQWKEPDPIRIGTSLWPGYDPFYVARNEEILNENEFKLVEYHTTVDVRRALRNGLIEIGAITLDEALYALEDGVDPIILMVCDYSAGADGIVASKDIKSIGDLKGKRVGVDHGSVSIYLLQRALEISGIRPDELKISFRNMDIQMRELKSGALDAAVLYEPHISTMKAKGFQEIFTSKEIPEEIVDVLITTRKFAQTHPEEIAKLRSIWYQSLHKMKTVNNLAKSANHHQTTVNGLNIMLDGIHFPDSVQSGQLVLGMSPTLLPVAERLLAYMEKSGLIKSQLTAKSVFEGK
jgi:NitT/TauT family transport system substrate-binding protein